MKILKRIMLFTSLALSLSVNAASTSKPFERGALTQLQLDSWDNYLADESSLYGCTYEDDPRLQEDPKWLLNTLYRKESVDPVKVTYRTLLSMGPSSREIISNNIVIASMECNTVYYDGKSLIGIPVIPFEEAITIMHDDYAMHKSEKRLLALKKTFTVAGMDPRWFWSYFVADRAHMDLIGLDFETLVTVDQIISGSKSKKEYKDDSFNLPYSIHQNLSHRPIAYYGSEGKCEVSSSEPAKELVVWPEITDEIIKPLYNLSNVRYSGKWKNKVSTSKEGLSLYQETTVQDNLFPAFNVTRGMSIHSSECRRDSSQPRIAQRYK